MAPKTDLPSVQEAFYVALKKSQDTVADLRLARTGKRGGTQEMLAIEPSAEMMGRTMFVAEAQPNGRTPHRRRTPSQMRISAPGMGDDEFQATLQLVKRLRELGTTTGAEIVCLDEGLRFRNGNAKFTCKGLQSFWTRVGAEPPSIRYTSESLEDVLLTNPVAVFMDPDRVPLVVPGYIQAILEEPYVCMLIRGA
jgi:hypothetical protein